MRAQADVWHPWVGSNRFLERLYALPAFRETYRKELERQLATLFNSERLDRRLDEVAAAVRPAVAESGAERLRRFDEATRADGADGASETGSPFDPNRSTWQIKRFVRLRAGHVRDQLEGKVEGLRVERSGRRRGGPPGPGARSSP